MIMKPATPAIHLSKYHLAQTPILSLDWLPICARYDKMLVDYEDAEQMTYNYQG